MLGVSEVNYANVHMNPALSTPARSSLWSGIIVGGLWLSFMLFRGSLSSVIKGRLIVDHVEHLHPFHCSSACKNPVYPPDPSPHQTLSDPSGGASSKRIPPCRAFSRVPPPPFATQQWGGVKACLTVGPPPCSCSAWLINHTPAARRVPSVVLCLNYHQQFGLPCWNDSYKRMPVQVCKRVSLCWMCALLGAVVR